MEAKLILKKKVGTKKIVIRNTNIEQQTNYYLKSHCELYCVILMSDIFVYFFSAFFMPYYVGVTSFINSTKYLLAIAYFCRRASTLLLWCGTMEESGEQCTVVFA